MPTPTAYDIMLDVRNSQNRMEDKLDKRIDILEKRQDSVESKVDTMWGKASIAKDAVEVVEHEI